MRRTTLAIGALAALSLAGTGGCTTTTAGPPPFSESPAPAGAPSVATPPPSPSTPDTVATPAAPGPTSTTATSTSAAPAPAPSRSTTTTPAATLRTSYPGIKKLVIIASRWNNTPAGIAALNTVAAYNSALTIIPAIKTTKPLATLFLPSCGACLGDIQNDRTIIGDGYRFRSPTGDIRAKMLTLYIEWRSGTQYMVRADKELPQAEIVDGSGKVVVRSPARVISTESRIETSFGAAKIVDYFAAPN